MGSGGGTAIAIAFPFTNKTQTTIYYLCIELVTVTVELLNKRIAKFSLSIFRQKVRSVINKVRHNYYILIILNFVYQPILWFVTLSNPNLYNGKLLLVGSLAIFSYLVVETGPLFCVSIYIYHDNLNILITNHSNAIGYIKLLTRPS